MQGLSFRTPSETPGTLSRLSRVRANGPPFTLTRPSGFCREPGSTARIASARAWPLESGLPWRAAIDA